MSEAQPETWEALAEEEALATADPEGVGAWALDLRETLGRRALDWFNALFGGESWIGALADAFTLLPWLLGLAALGVLLVALFQVGRVLARARQPGREEALEEALEELPASADLHALAREALSAGHYAEAIGHTWGWVRTALDEQGLGPLSADQTHGEVVRQVRRAGAESGRLSRLRAFARQMDRWRYGGTPPGAQEAQEALQQAQEVLQ